MFDKAVKLDYLLQPKNEFIFLKKTKKKKKPCNLIEINNEINICTLIFKIKFKRG